MRRGTQRSRQMRWRFLRKCIASKEIHYRPQSEMTLVSFVTGIMSGVSCAAGWIFGILSVFRSFIFGTSSFKYEVSIGSALMQN